MDDEKIIDPRYLEQLRSLPSAPHDDKQDAAALATLPTAGILGYKDSIDMFKPLKFNPLLVEI